MSDKITNFNPETGKTKKRKWKIYPLYIHIGFILLLTLVIAIFFLSDFSLFTQTQDKPEISLTGQIEDLNIPYSDDLTVETSKYTLIVAGSKFDGKSEKFHIKNFSGDIKVLNKSVIFSGTSKNITYGNNQINLDGDNFQLKSIKRTSLLDLTLRKINLSLKKGNFKFGKSLSQDFENLNISLNDINSTLNYDGKISLNGYADRLYAISNQNLEIKYTFKNSSKQNNSKKK